MRVRHDERRRRGGSARGGGDHDRVIAQPRRPSHRIGGWAHRAGACGTAPPRPRRSRVAALAGDGRARARLRVERAGPGDVGRADRRLSVLRGARRPGRDRPAGGRDDGAALRADRRLPRQGARWGLRRGGEGAAHRLESSLRGAELGRLRGRDAERPVVRPALGDEQHGPDRRNPGRGYRRTGGMGRRDGVLERRRRRHGQRHRLRPSRPGGTAVGQHGRELRVFGPLDPLRRPDGRRGRRRQRPRRRLAWLGLGLERQQPIRRQQPRHPRRGHDRCRREQRRRRRRRQLEREDRRAEVPQRGRQRVDCGRDQRDALLGRRGHPDLEQLVGRWPLQPGSPRRDRVRRGEGDAVRRRRRELQHEHRPDAALPVLVRRRRDHGGCGDRAQRPEVDLLELRGHHGRPGSARGEHPLDGARRRLPPLQRHVDGHAARRGGGGARQVALSERHCLRAEGAAHAHGRPEGVPHRPDDHGWPAQSELGRLVRERAEGRAPRPTERVQRQHGAAARDSRARCELRDAGRARQRQRDRQRDAGHDDGGEPGQRPLHAARSRRAPPGRSRSRRP